MPPFDYDLGDAGKKVSDGWMFWTSYNTERATGKLEVTASQRDRDYIAAVDWKAAEKAVGRGQGRHDRRREGARSRRRSRASSTSCPAASRRTASTSRPTASGSSARASSRASRPSSTSRRSRPRSATRTSPATRTASRCSSTSRSRTPRSPVGLGPLHTQFGPDGYAYTSLFVDSAIAKWKLGTWEVVDKVPMSYSIGHLRAAEGDTVSPGRQVPRRPQQALARPAPVGRAVAAGVVAARGHHARRR